MTYEETILDNAERWLKENGRLAATDNYGYVCVLVGLLRKHHPNPKTLGQVAWDARHGYKEGGSAYPWEDASGSTKEAYEMMARAVEAEALRRAQKLGT